MSANGGPGDRVPGPGMSAADPAERDDPDQPVSTLRGPGVEVDRRRLGQATTALVLVALLVTSAALFATGAHRNAQADELRHGIPVEATVTRCIGLLGGSGSNAAGYSCDGTYVVGGKRFSVTLPQSALLRVGSHVGLTAAAGNPALVATPAQARSGQSSWKVFVLPAILLVAALCLVAVIVVRTRSRRVTSPDNSPATRP